MQNQTNTSRSLTYFAWFLVGYTILVILWGAFVRATGSGAGCGSNWPTCNGEIIPRAESVETLIEFSHRVTSAFMGVLVIVLVAWSWRFYGLRHRATIASIVTLVFTLIEGGIGAGLVIFELVADNPSSARALWMGAHLINTLILMGVLTAAAWWCSGGAPISLKKNRTLVRILAFGLFGLLIVSAFGAITALGDTLFPAESFAEGAAAKFDQEAHFSVRARIWHPTIAVGVTIYMLVILFTQPELSATPRARRWQRINICLLGGQILIGVINVLLAAPVWMQLVHLLMTDLIWSALIIHGMVVFEVEPAIATAESTPAVYGGAGQIDIERLNKPAKDSA